jgi:hypothetical protein
VVAVEEEEEGGWVVGSVDDGVVVVVPTNLVVDSAATATAVHDNVVAAFAIQNIILDAAAVFDSNHSS